MTLMRVQRRASLGLGCKTLSWILFFAVFIVSASLLPNVVHADDAAKIKELENKLAEAEKKIAEAENKQSDLIKAVDALTKVLNKIDTVPDDEVDEVRKLFLKLDETGVKTAGEAELRNQIVKLTTAIPDQINAEILTKPEMVDLLSKLGAAIFEKLTNTDIETSHAQLFDSLKQLSDRLSSPTGALTTAHVKEFRERRVSGEKKYANLLSVVKKLTTADDVLMQAALSLNTELGQRDAQSKILQVAEIQTALRGVEEGIATRLVLLDIEKGYGIAYETIKSLAEELTNPDGKLTAAQMRGFRERRADSRNLPADKLIEHAENLLTQTNKEGVVIGRVAGLLGGNGKLHGSNQDAAKLLLAKIVDDVDDANSEIKTLAKNKFHSDDLMQGVNDLLSVVTERLTEAEKSNKAPELRLFVVETERQLSEAGDDAAKKKAIPVYAAMEKLTPLLSASRLHVVHAQYGRLKGRGAGKAFCNATTAMRKLCNRKVNCNAPQDANNFVDPKPLCGFDPSPTARGLARGLVVTYSCHRGGDILWEALAREPRYDPVTGDKLKKSNGNVETAVLYSAGQQIACTYPVQ